MSRKKQMRKTCCNCRQPVPPKPYAYLCEDCKEARRAAYRARLAEGRDDERYAAVKAPAVEKYRQLRELNIALFE